MRLSSILAMYKNLLLSLITFFLVSTGWCAELHLQDHPAGIWSIVGSQKERRWLVIHNLARDTQSGVYHIEVLGLASGDPAWKVKRLVNHMAITPQALLRSVVAPLAKGAVYPEPFDTAYALWQSQNGGSGGEVCQTNVLQCFSP